MPSFSKTSQTRLDTCAEPLRRLFQEVVQSWDCTILEGERTPEQQAINVRKGVSKTLLSKHIPAAGAQSRAVDVAPFPLAWPDRQAPNYAKALARFYFFGGYVLGVAARLGIPVVWGGDWDGDHDIHEQDFDDLVHWELP
jgi:peptidoglycan L-alanyl-D-glutamate endopeptidase CwlK